MESNDTTPMQRPAEYIHEESFAYLATGDGIAVALIEERNQAIELVKEILTRLTKLNTLMTRYCPINGEAYEMLASDLVDNILPYSNNFSSHETSIRKRIDGKYWNKLLTASKCTTLMNTGSKQTVQAAASTDAPEFNYAAVTGTLQYHYENRFNTFVEAGIELFDALPGSYKSNDQFCLRKKIIFSNALFRSGWNHYSTVQNRIHDIERIFMILDRKDPDVLRSHETAPLLMERAKRAHEDTYTNSYFIAVFYKNGNIHLTFTRPDLVDRFNEMLAKYHGNTLGHRKAKR